MKFVKSILAIVVCTVIVALPLMSPQSSQAQTPGQNLLVDGDFEAPPVWPMQDGIGEVQVAPGWRAWYLDQPPSYVNRPNNCDKDRADCYWMRPEFRDTVLESAPNRVHGGIRAQKYFSFGRMHEAGLYQRVIGVTSGATLRFSIYIQAWQCFNIDACGKYGIRSDQPAEMHLKVGIDPYGGSDPFSGNIIWSPEREAFDRWVEFSVEAKAQGDAVTVFTHSRAEWDWARGNNDVYLDDASLTIVGQSQPGITSTPQAPAAAQVPGTPRPTNTSGPTNTPGPTRTPRPDGAVIHVVRPGDTMYGISLEYDVPVEELYTLNNLTRESILNIGQEIVVKVGTPQATATPKVTATVTPTVALPTLPPLPTATPIPVGLCLSAFEDLNNNLLRDGNEPSLASVTFVVSSGGNEVARYATDGSGQSYCMTQLPPGAYSAQIVLPPGYVAPFEKIDVTLTLGQKVELALAARRGEKAALTATPTVKAQATESSPARSNSTLMILIVLGIAFLILIGVALVIIRRGR